MSEDTLDNEQWDERSKEDLAYDEMIAREDNQEDDPNNDMNQSANHDDFTNDEEYQEHHNNDEHFKNGDHLEENTDDNDRTGDGEKEEENEFVVWADDADEPGEDEKKASNNKSSSQQESDVKFSVEMVKDKDQISLVWNGDKILVPCKDEILRDMKVFNRQLNIIAYPILVEDIFTENLSPLIKSAVNVSMEMDETSEGLPIKGYLRMKFQTLSDIKTATEVLKSLSTDERTVHVQHFSENDSEGHILSKVKGKIAPKDFLPERLLFVSNFCNTSEESTADGATLEKELRNNFFPDCSRIVLLTKDERVLGHAYIEFGSDETMKAALERTKDAMFNDRHLFVIKAMNEKKEATGLLKDSLRQYWLEQIKTLESTNKEKKSAKEISDMEQKLYRYKKRIVTDNIKRQELGIPIPEEEQFQLDPEKEEKEQEREKERTAHSNSRKRSTSRKRSPLRSRRFSPPPRRSRGSYRGGSSNYGGPSRRGGANSDDLVNQLQHLVGVLSNKLPIETNRYDYHDRDGGRSSYMESRPRDRYTSGGYSDSRRGYDNKRMGPDDYDRERKRRYEDSDYARYDRGPDYRSYRGGPRW